jgi:hypothetical protein
METTEWDYPNEETERAGAVHIVHFGCSLSQGPLVVCGSLAP